MKWRSSVSVGIILSSSDLVEPIKMIHARSMAIAPFNMDTVPSDRFDFNRFNIGFKLFSLECPLSRNLVDTGGAGAFKSEIEGSNFKCFPILKLQEDFCFGRANFR